MNYMPLHPDEHHRRFYYGIDPHGFTLELVNTAWPGHAQTLRCWSCGAGTPLQEAAAWTVRADDVSAARDTLYLCPVCSALERT